jgi:hypothetical protein
MVEEKELPNRPGASDFEEATERLAPYDQRVFAGYSVEDGILRPQGDRTRWYFPVTARGAVSEFAAVTPGSRRDAMTFVCRWGLLGWYGIKHGEGGGADAGGDPLPWVWAHAHGVRIALDLCSLLRREDEDALEQYLDGLTVTDTQAEAALRLGGVLRGVILSMEMPPRVKAEIVKLGSVAFGASRGGQDHGFIHGARDGVSVWRAPANPGEAPSSVARKLIGNIVNPHLRGVFAALAYEHAGPGQGVLGLTRHYRFDSLLSVIYYHIADIAVGGRIAVCRECGLPFVQTDRRQNFCPAPPDARESRCAARFHQREYRKRKGGSP